MRFSWNTATLTITIYGLLVSGCAGGRELSGREVMASQQADAMRACIRTNAVELDDGRSPADVIGRAAAQRCIAEINAVKGLVGGGVIYRQSFREALDQSVVDYGTLAVLEAR